MQGEGGRDSDSKGSITLIHPNQISFTDVCVNNHVHSALYTMKERREQRRKKNHTL